MFLQKEKKKFLLKIRIEFNQLKGNRNDTNNFHIESNRKCLEDLKNLAHYNEKKLIGANGIFKPRKKSFVNTILCCQ